MVGAPVEILLPLVSLFVARQRELTELAATLETARAGEGQILFVIGGAGRGKTMLAQEFIQRAQAADAELIVISGHCNAHTGIGDPYLPFREALTTLAGDVEAKWAGGLISRRPKPSRSGNPGCAPMLSPCVFAARTVRHMTRGSEA